MSEVVRARHVLTGQDVAVKILAPEFSQNASIVSRFVEEARTLALLEHPNIVALHNFVQRERRLYLVMQFVDGTTLEGVIQRRGGRVPVPEAVPVACRVLDALEYAHKRGVIHRDIKPSNILVNRDGVVKVTDFGIAKFNRPTKLTETGQTLGTVRYMAPEQVRGGELDGRTDLYALGITLYETITGRLPFVGNTHFDLMSQQLSAAPPPPSSLVPDLPRGLEDVILCALQKDPAARFPDARTFRSALELVLAGQVGRTSELIPAVTPSPGKRRRDLRLAAGAVVALGCVALALGVRSRVRGVGAPRTTAPRVGTPATPATPVPERGDALSHPGLAAIQRAVDVDYPEPVGLRIISTASIDPARLRDRYEEAKQRYGKALATRGRRYSSSTVAPLVLVLAPQALLNRAELFPELATQSDSDYPTRYLYMPRQSLLFVRSEAGFEQEDLAYGFGLHLCVAGAGLSDETCVTDAEALVAEERSSVTTVRGGAPER
jgi:hypothetical protein